MSVIKIPNNEFFNKDFNQVRNRFLGTQIDAQKFKEINFFYLFNLPHIIRRNNEISSIKINDNLEKFRWHIDFIKSIKERRNKMLSLFSENGYELSNIPPLTLSWRLVIGLGASHPQETSMTLHHIYGIPYIPGSAVKGVTRHRAVLKFAEELAKNNNLEIEKAIEEVSKKLENGEETLNISLDNISFQDLIKIFGTQKQEGKVIFFDAYPDEDIRLKIDIMNPHYPDYYTGDKPPTDWQNPVPIKFLTVDEKTKFQFYLASKDEDLLNKARTLLKDALRNYGIGAKTSLGYGMFQ